MLSTICLLLSLLCGLSGIMLLVFPREFMKVAKVMNKEYSTEKFREQLEKDISTDSFRELLDRNIDIDAKLFRFCRLIGLASLIVGIYLLIIFFVYH